MKLVRSIQPARAPVPQWCAIATAVILIAIPAQAVRPHGGRVPSRWWSYTDPVPPPPMAPELWSRFWFLYSGYSSLPSPKPITFAEWLLRHGIVDADDQHAMLVLYRWIESFG
ncbi:MAG: hypothetical protein U0575_09550 [Phycisphaerales bacterium]